MNRKIIINVILLIILLTQSLANPSNLMLDFKDEKLFIVKAEESDIPKGFYKGSSLALACGFEYEFEIYINGPLKLMRVCDEDYNYRYLAIDEYRDGMLRELYIQEVNGEKYYIIPTFFNEYENSVYELHAYNIWVRDQVMACYYSDKYNYEKVVYGINSDGKLDLFYYEDDEFKLLDPIQEKNDTTQSSNVTEPQNTSKTNNTPQSTNENQPNELNSFSYITIIYIVIIVALLVCIKLLMVKLLELRKK